MEKESRSAGAAYLHRVPPLAEQDGEQVVREEDRVEGKYCKGINRREKFDGNGYLPWLILSPIDIARRIGVSAKEAGSGDGESKIPVKSGGWGEGTDDDQADPAWPAQVSRVCGIMDLEASHIMRHRLSAIPNTLEKERV